MPTPTSIREFGIPEPTTRRPVARALGTSLTEWIARRKRRHGLAMPLLPTVVLIIVMALAVFGPLISPCNPVEGNILASTRPPLSVEEGVTHWLGTDHLGRDILSRVIGGARISVVIGVLSVSLAAFIGTSFALLSGYLGGWTERLIMRLTDVALSMPFLMVALVFAAVFGSGMRNLILIFGLWTWPQYARVLRSEVLRLKEADYVKLAIIAGSSKWRIMVRHLLPNMVNTLLILATLQLGTVIISEATLSFLGLGVPPPAPSWGLIIAQGRQYITQAWWICLFPGLALMLFVMSCNMLGDWLRIRLDPSFRRSFR